MSFHKSKKQNSSESDAQELHNIFKNRLGIQFKWFHLIGI